jgi:hypothetical protein
MQVETKEAFQASDWTAMMVIQHFDGTEGSTDINTNTSCRGFTYTSKACLQSAKSAYDALSIPGNKATGLRLMSDATYKLVSNRWTLSILATYVTTYSKGDFHHSIRPLMFGMHYSESQNACECLVSSLVYASKSIHYHMCSLTLYSARIPRCS